VKEKGIRRLKRRGDNPTRVRAKRDHDEYKGEIASTYRAMSPMRKLIKMRETRAHMSWGESSSHLLMEVIAIRTLARLSKAVFTKVRV
jgi:hypothetical protein